MPSIGSSIKRERLDNGLEILLCKDSSVPIVTSMIWYRVGSRYETPGATGISHFLEHMMFKGTRRYARGQIDAITMINGGANNAFTSHDYTAYYFTFASDRWDQALEIESNRLADISLDPEEFELEKQVIIEELKMDLDSPWGALRQAVETRALDRHPYRFPIIGLHEDLEKMSVGQMRRHYETYYRPNNATLVIAGDIDPAPTLRRVRRLFGKAAARPLPQQRVPVEPEQKRQKRVVLHKNTPLDRMILAFHAPSITSPDYYALHLIDKILSEGRTSRLYRRLVEKDKLVSFSTSEYSETIDPHLFFIRAELRPAVRPRQVETVIFEELDRLASKPVSRRELERARNQTSLQFLESFETTIDQAIRIGLYETVAGDCRFSETFLTNLSQVTPAQIQNLAARTLVRRKSTVGLLTP